MTRFLKTSVNFFAGTWAAKFFKSIPIKSFIYRKFVPKKEELVVECLGNRMHVNARDSGIAPDLFFRGIYEPFETKLFLNLISENMRVMNIGANFGYYVMLAAKKVGVNGKVYAFEPEPKNYQLLLKNIKENGYGNVVPVQAAISDKPGVLKLFLDSDNAGNHSLGGEGKYLQVKADTVDNYLEIFGEKEKIDIIQMDTQGSEGLILDGAFETISRSRPKIIMEFWPYGLKNVGTDALGLLKKIESYGFRVSVIDEKLKSLRCLSPYKIVEECVRSKNGKGFVNLLLEMV
ncbi:MAG: FkbM family methyltransferase [Candidatus Omnitrophota bacterium]